MSKQEQTRKNFMEAFWKLYQKQPVHTITIGTLCKTAGYSRTTFYEYFCDIYDVQERFERQVIEDFWDVLKDYIVFEKKIDELELMLVQGFPKAYLSCEKYMDVLLGKNGDPAFPRRMYDFMLCYFEEELSNHARDYRYLMEYAHLALLSVLSAWNRDGRPVSLERVMEAVLAGIKISFDSGNDLW